MSIGEQFNTSRKLDGSRYLSNKDRFTDAIPFEVATTSVDEEKAKLTIHPEYKKGQVAAARRERRNVRQSYQ